MRTVGIICEYNPFHLGHKRQIDALRGMGYDCIVCVMSGNFTQRGELAMFDKYTRAESTVLGGADVVLELPFPYSSMSAEGFAEAGVHILGSLGLDSISFGSECADTELLERAADAILSGGFIALYARLQKTTPSAKAYFDALGTILGQDVSLLSNDILAISYIRAIRRLGYNMDIVPIKREGLGYNDTELRSDALPSASAIRTAINSGNVCAISSYMPSACALPLEKAISEGLAPVSAQGISRELHSFFRMMTPSEINARAVARSGGGDGVSQDGCGIVERLCSAAKTTNDFDSFVTACYNAKYTDARINRVMLFSALGVSDKLTHCLPVYTTLLAASNGGRALLAKWRKNTSFPIVTKPADAPADLQSTICRAADELYASAIPKSVSSDYFIKQKPYVAHK